MEIRDRKQRSELLPDGDDIMRPFRPELFRWHNTEGSDRKTEGSKAPKSDRESEVEWSVPEASSHPTTITTFFNTTGQNGSRTHEGKTRDQVIFDLLDRHPMTIDQLVRIGLFPSAKIAQRRMMKLVQRRKVKLCGMAQLNDRGRPSYVFARWTLKVDTCRHEVLLTEFLIPFFLAEIIRGYETDRTLRPDAEMTINGHKYLVEQDCCTMSYHDIVHKRFKKYEGYDGVVLWVTLTDARMDGLRRRAERVKDNALFTTLTSSLKEPFGGVWIDYSGHIHSMPQPDVQSGHLPSSGTAG